MAQSPLSTSETLLTHLTGLGRELVLAATPVDVLDLLVARTSSAFAASECAARWREVDSLGASAPVIRSRPLAVPHRDRALSLAEHGAGGWQGDLEAACLSAGIDPPASDPHGSWLLVPLLAGKQVAGGLAIRSGPGAFVPADLATAQAFAALAGLALERLRSRPDAVCHGWQEALDAIHPALCVIDESECIRCANRAFAVLMGAEGDALIGRPWRSLSPPDWASELDPVIRGETAERHVELQRGDRMYAVSAVPVPGAGGRDVVVLFDDQTDRHRLQDLLIQSEKMSAIGQLIAGVAHDLNNPLASVVGFAEFLFERPDVPAALREPITVIREEAERASGIVKNLLGFARKQDRQHRPAEIRPLLESTLALLRNELMAARVSARLEIEPDPPLASVDPNQIQQVFVNLVHNAAQAIAATGRPGSVIVRVRRWTDGLAVDVTDDGPGMSEPLAAQAFDPFFTTKPEGQGTGLGLSISQGIVTEHGGRITLETVEGMGSTFTVYLPAGEDSAPPAVADGSSPPAPALRILVVDDEPHIVHYMRATLESWGHTVSEAADGAEARELLARSTFDLVIADLRMPRLGGREFYEGLRRETPTLADRVVFATGDTVRGDTLAFLKSVGRPYLHKPFSLGELRALLAGVSKAPGA